MSVYQLLLDNQHQNTPSMEAAQLEQGLDEMYKQAHFLIGTMQQAATDSLSMESSCVLEALGYSTEAEEKKGLMHRIWEGIKAIFRKIKEFIGRLVAIRKHHLQDNEFKFEKLKKYIHNLDMNAKPEGKMSVSMTFLPAEPGKLHSVLNSVRSEVKTVIAWRSATISGLCDMDVKTLEHRTAEEVIKPHLGNDKVIHGEGGDLVFENSLNRVEFRAKLKPHTGGVQMEAFSVVTMGALITSYEELLRDDKVFTMSLSDYADKGKKLEAALDKLSDDNSFRNLKADGDLNDFEAAVKKSTHIFKQCGIISNYLYQVQRTSHSLIFDVLFSDLEDLLRKSLAQYKFKKHELHKEDREMSPADRARKEREDRLRDVNQQRASNYNSDHEYR